MSAEPKRRRWWSKKRWWAAVILAALAAYPASVGPAAYGVGRGWGDPAIFRTAYDPLDSGATLIVSADSYHRYLDWWYFTGIRHGE